MAKLVRMKKLEEVWQKMQEQDKQKQPAKATGRRRRQTMAVVPPSPLSHASKPAKKTTRSKSTTSSPNDSDDKADYVPPKIHTHKIWRPSKLIKFSVCHLNTVYIVRIVFFYTTNFQFNKINISSRK